MMSKREDHSGQPGHPGHPGHGHGHPEVYRITGARSSLTEDVRGRQRRYIISMLVRTLCVILTVVLWQVSRPLAIATLVAGALLPYIAVVIANAGRENAPGLPNTFVRVLPRQMLGEPEEKSTGENPAEGNTAEGNTAEGNTAGEKPSEGSSGGSQE